MEVRLSANLLSRQHKYKRNANALLMYRSRAVNYSQLHTTHLHQALPHSLVGCTSHRTTVDNNVFLLYHSSARSKHIVPAHFVSERP